MEIGRNLEIKDGVYSVVFRWVGDKTYRRWNLDTHRKAMLKMTKLKKSGDWLPINEDITI